MDPSQQTTTKSALFDTIGTISVVQFGARRLPELQALYHNACRSSTAAAATTKIEVSNATHTNQKRSSNATTTTIKALQSSGRKKSQRHLRRRTTSYKRYKQNRYYYKKGMQRSSITSNPNNHDPTNKLLQQQEQSISLNYGGSRKVRRQNRLQLCNLHETWRWTSNSSNDKTKESETKDDGESRVEANKIIQTAARQSSNDLVTNRTNWMKTHLYYVKRCFMTKVSWPSIRTTTDTDTWSIPIQHNNRGASAALRLVQDDQKCLIQDTTWNMHQPIWFRLQQSYEGSDKEENVALVQQQFLQIIQQMIPIFSLSDMACYDTNHFDNSCNTFVVGDDSNVIYEPNQFPNHAIGPLILCLYSKINPIFYTASAPILFESNCESDTRCDYIYIFVHLSIQSIVFSHLKSLCQKQRQQQQQQSIDTPVRIDGPCYGNFVQGGMSCIQLRGSNDACNECFHKSFCSIDTQDRTIESYHNAGTGKERNEQQNESPQQQDLVQMIYNFVCSTQVQHQRKEQKQLLYHNIISMFHLKSNLLVWNRQHQNQQHSSSTSDQLFLIYIRRVCPRCVSLPCNYGVCGYDVYCPSEFCKLLFLNFIHCGNACIIGAAEDAYITLECIPPLLLFPRDYPDTMEGKKYWTNTSREWKLIRHHWEGGGGRIAKISPEQISAINENTKEFRADHSLPVELTRRLDDNIVDWASNYNLTIVVVRTNEFLDPFLNALFNCTNFALHKDEDVDEAILKENAKESPVQRHRRCHRSRKGMTHQTNVVHAPLLSKDRRNNHKLTCQLLIDNLSTALSAVLMCTVQVYGKGTLLSGCRIYSSTLVDVHQNDSTVNDVFLGWVTAGVFSLSRGSRYGLAMVGVRAYLTTIVNFLSSDPKTDTEMDQNMHSNIMIALCAITKTKSIQLRVYIENPNDRRIRYEGIISLIQYS